MRKQTVILSGSISKLGKIVADGFERAGYSTVVATNWRLALELAASSKPALILFEAESIDSEILEAWNQVVEDKRVRRIPLLLLGGKRAERGPVAPLCNEAFVSADVRPAHVGSGDAKGTDTRMIRTGPLVMDLNRHTVTYDGAHLRLTPTEFRVLHLLASHSGRVVLRTEVQRLMEWAQTPKAARVHITALRKKLGSTGAKRLRTVHGVGFIWSNPADPASPSGH